MKEEELPRRLTRYYFTCDRLDDLEPMEQELRAPGRRHRADPRALSQDDLGCAQHRHLHAVPSFMKLDVVHSSLVGAVLGLGLALLAVLAAYWAGLGSGEAGPALLAFVALVILGFTTWQGGLWGIQTRNARFRRFEQAMREGRHVFFVDAATGQQPLLKEIADRYPGLQTAGMERGAPGWLVFSQHRVTHFFTHTFP